MTGAVVVAALALTATPARVQLDGAGKATVQVTNRGRQPVVLDVSRAGFALDLGGRPRIVAATRPAWLSFAPARVAIQPGDAAALTITARVPAGARPGDHAGVLLLASRPLARGSVAVRVRLGVVVVLRVPGTVVHRLALTALRARKHVLTLALANRGNVAETLAPSRLTVTLWRRGKLVARLHASAQEVLPGTRALLRLRYRGPLRGTVVARADLGPARRSVRLRL